jgi:hypothetical protein
MGVVDICQQIRGWIWCSGGEEGLSRMKKSEKKKERG